MTEETENPSTPAPDDNPEDVAEKEVDGEQVENGELSDDAKALSEELDKIKVEPPTVK